MRTCSLKLSETDFDLLKQHCEQLEKSKSEVLRYGLHCITEVLQDNTDKTAGQSDILAVLTEQLRVKDEQIKALNESLKSALEQAERAQLLHARTIPALESTEQKEEKRGWKFWKH